MNQGLLCLEKDSKEFLRTRVLHLATPAYAGSMKVNYVSSLISLINTCRDMGINYIVSVVYDESLISRARNKLAHDFMQGSATDCFFIDSDIGFNALDIIHLMLRKEDIIGAPCVRKNLRFDRIVAATKKNGRDYSNDELRVLVGDYAFSFVEHEKQSINLGQLFEVNEIGTGLMRVRRESFQKVKETFPDRMFVLASGKRKIEDNPSAASYMYFNSGIDEDTRWVTSGGIPEYIPEDFWFCRTARKAGMHVWVAPWIKTTHTGSYIYQGDLEAVANVGGILS